MCTLRIFWSFATQIWTKSSFSDSLLDLKLIVKVNFIVGFPDESRSDIFKTLLMIWKLALIKTNDCNISAFAPCPGSELFRELEDEGTFGTINDKYFEGLITQFDLTIPKSFCRKIGGVEIMIYRILGMGIFYLLSYLRKPSRFVRLYKLLTSKTFLEANSLFEQLMLDLKHRIVDLKKEQKPNQT